MSTITAHKQLTVCINNRLSLLRTSFSANLHYHLHSEKAEGQSLLEKPFLASDYVFFYFDVLSAISFPQLFSCILNNLTLHNILSILFSLAQNREIYFSPTNIIIEEYVSIEGRYILCCKKIKTPYQSTCHSLMHEFVSYTVYQGLR